MSTSPVTLINGVLCDGQGASIYGTLQAGVGFAPLLRKTRALMLDRSTSVNSSVANANAIEQFTLDVAGTSETGKAIFATVPSSAGAAQSYGKIALAAGVSQGVTASGGVRPEAYALYGTGTAAAADCAVYGVAGAAVIPASTDGPSAGMLASSAVSNGSAQSSVGQSNSKYALLLDSQGTTKPTAFAYARKNPVAVGAANCTHGYVADAASVDTTSFATISGGSTVLWGRDAAGKRLVSVTSGSGAGPIAASAASHITVTTPSQTAAAGAVGTAIQVNTTAVTASSRILANIQSYSGTLGTNGLPVVYITAVSAGASFSFAIANAHNANALSGTVVVAFTIEN